MAQEVNVQSLVDLVNAQPDPYPAIFSLLYLLLDRTRMHSEDKQSVLSDVSDVFDGIPPSPRAAFSGVLSLRPKKKGRQKAAT